MSLVRKFLREENVNLDMRGVETCQQAQDLLFESLRWDDRVVNFDAFASALITTPVMEEGGHGILIAHGRTDAVRTLIIAAGRLGGGCVAVTDATVPLCLVFVLGIPNASNADYLRTVGIIARACRSETTRSELLAAPTPEEFISVLSRVEKNI